MGRKNRREPPPEPINVSEVAPQVVTVARMETDEERDRRIEAQFGRRRERMMRRRDARVLGAIADWSICCIPGCGERLPYGLAVPAAARKVNERLPVCDYHQIIIAKQVDYAAADAEHFQMRDRLAKRIVEEETERYEAWKARDQNHGAPEGQIYFVRLNGMIKVGWSMKLRDRLKSYGASAEVLCHYPGSRTDEVNLHRQLRNELARGREWYHDNDVLAHFVSEALARHGDPTILPYWSEPKKPVVKIHRR
jgi:hypothetical protein